MSEYDDLLDEVLTEPEGIRSDLARGAAKDQTAPKWPPRKRESSGSVSASKTSPEVKRGKRQAKAAADPNLPTPDLARRGMSRLLERTGRCPMYVPRGTVCKTCGKVHPV